MQKLVISNSVHMRMGLHSRYEIYYTLHTTHYKINIRGTKHNKENIGILIQRG